MKIHKKMFYNIKRLIPMAGIATLTMLPTSCGPDSEPMKIEQNDQDKKRENTPTDTVVPTDTIAKPVDTRHDVEMFFVSQTAKSSLDERIIQMHINDSTVRTIYITPTGNWNDATSREIHLFRDRRLQPTLKMSSKIRGRGDFNFMLGEASKTLADSLWYTQNGWTINNPNNKLPLRDAEIIFTPDILTTIDPTVLIACCNDVTLRDIYLTTRGHWNHYTAEDINDLRQSLLQYNIEYSPKMHGRGDFDFKPGEASKNIYDSLWYVQQGWTINKDLQR